MILRRTFFALLHGGQIQVAGWRKTSHAIGVLCSILITVLLTATPHLAVAVPIQITYTNQPGQGFNDPTLGAARRNAFEAAASHWSQLLPGTVPIVISAAMTSLPGGPNSAVLGSAGPSTFFINASGLPRANVYYPVALANQFAGQDLNQGSPEIVAQFNSDVDNATILGNTGFYYGTDAKPGSNIDFYSVVLHEFGHGLGFIDSINQGGDFDLNGNPDIYDTFLANGPALSATRLTALSQSARAAVLTSNALYFAGPNANAANSGSNARIYAPNPYQPGSSTGHLDEATYHGINELMTPVASEPTHDPGPVALGVFHDIGWGKSTAVAPTPTPASKPPNDNFAAALALNGDAGSVKGTNINATKELSEPSHASNPGGKSVWYRWKAAAAGSMTINLTGAGFTSLLGVYTGTKISALTSVASSKTGSVTFSTVNGTTYNLAVDGFNTTAILNSAASGSFTLNWIFTSSAVPANNNFAQAQVVTGTSGRVTGTTVGATKEPGEPNHAADFGGKSIWYRWTAPANGKVTFGTIGSNFDTVIAVYTGTAVNKLTHIADNDDALGGQTSSVTFSTIKGTVYNIAVDGFNASTTNPTLAVSGNVVFTWSFLPFSALIAQAPVSSVTLSTAGADATTSLIHLRFSGALDESVASDPATYAVTVNGVKVAIASVAYLPNSHSVTLALAEPALRLGDGVTMQWSLQDAAGHSLAGHSGVLVAR